MNAIQSKAKTCLFCEKSLGEAHPNRRYCNLTCRNRALRRRNPNQDKSVKRSRQKRYLREGIMLPPETEPVFYNYKEPLRKVEEGYGYMGVLAGNKEGTHVQCHICGYMFSYLPGHIGKHDLNASGYKDKFGLMQKTALVSEQFRKQLIANYQQRNDKAKNGLRSIFDAINNARRGGDKKMPPKIRTRYSLERRNIEGVCPDQLLEKIKDLAEDLGRVPSNKEFRAAYTRFGTALIVTFGTWNRAVKMAGFVPVGETKDAQYREQTSRERLIQYLREFYSAHGRIPQTSDFKRGLLPYKSAYYKEFGGLVEARKAAKLPALVVVGATGWRKAVEMTKKKVGK